MSKSISKLSEIPDLPEMTIGHGVEMTKTLAITRSANNALTKARQAAEKLHSPTEAGMQGRPLSHHHADARNLAINAVGLWLRGSETLLKTLPMLSGDDLPDAAQLKAQHESVQKFWRSIIENDRLIS